MYTRCCCYSVVASFLFTSFESAPPSLFCNLQVMAAVQMKKQTQRIGEMPMRKQELTIA
ncbi:MAG: hypothetical protein ACKPKO_00030 [Candidatus Fonsibacter sp.]